MPEQEKTSPESPIFEIAFMPDVHFHDLFADFEPGSFDGLPITWRGEEKMAKIRTMESQLNSTRLFNENYFAFLAALDDIAARGITQVALPGDFSDDGQPAHIRGLAAILDDYRDRYGMNFFLTPGNHDPTRPFATEAGKEDYLGEGGLRQPVFSRNHSECFKEDQVKERDDAGNIIPKSHSVACTDDVKEMGYRGLYEMLGGYGLTHQETYLYYETPFSGSDNSDASSFIPENRMYEVCHEGSGGIYRENHFTNCFDVPDMSYLVEPVEGIWLLALDTNVYMPRPDADQSKTNHGDNFYGSGNAGYNRVLTHKKHLLPWMSDLATRAEEQGKMLINFSHFPAADFNNGAGPLIEEVWGEDEFQMTRMPEPKSTAAVAATGIRLHVAGHMHMNGLEIATDSLSGRTLTNIQVPSLAAYVPAYKIVRTFEDKQRIEIETVVLEDIHGFDTLFPLYDQEWSYLNSIGYERIWNRNILESETYLEFTDWHIRELSRLRFLPGEWPGELRELLNNSTGRHLLAASFLPQEIWNELSWSEIKKNIDGVAEVPESELDMGDLYRQAINKAVERAESDGFSLSDFEKWDGETLSTDFYRLRNAGELALKHISEERIGHYSVIAEVLSDHSELSVHGKSDSLNKSLHVVFEVMALFSSRLPSEHVMINLDTGELTEITD